MIATPALVIAMTGSTITPGASEGARYVAEQVRRSRVHLEYSQTFGADRDQLRAALYATFMETRENGWDGYGAAAVHPDTYRVARRLLDALPHGFPLPTFGAEPDGHITFEWHRAAKHTVSLSISPEGDLHFAALHGTERDYGSRVFFGELPARIAELVRRLYAA